MQSQGRFIYWEKQGTDRLCGVHCINSLLQGPFYDEIQLANIAQELDKREKILMAEEGFSTNDFLKFMKEESGNVADDGNYSIQVLAEALKRVGDLECNSIDSKLAKESGDLSQEEGFICNSSAHWFAIRKVNEKWYNLNSTNKHGPELISDFYLSAFLNSVREGGYTIFVVQGIYPPSEKNMWESHAPYQHWISEEACQKIHQKNLKNKDYELNIGGTDERDFKKAMKESLKDYKKNNNDEEELNEKQEEEDKKLKPFQGKGLSLSESAALTPELQKYFKLTDPNEDPELAMVINISIKEKFASLPPEDENNLSLNLRFPDGSMKNWVFPLSATVEDVYDFVKVNIPSDKPYKFRIATSYPRAYIIDLKRYLLEVGISSHDSLIVDKI